MVDLPEQAARDLRGFERMKKMMLLGALMLVGAAAYGQESRQDVSFSGTGLFGPQVNGNAVRLDSTGALGHSGELPVYADAAQRAGAELQFRAELDEVCDQLTAEWRGCIRATRR